MQAEGGSSRTSAQYKVYDSVVIRRVLRALLFEGVEPKTRAKHIYEGGATGFEYMRGVVADMFQRTSAMNS